MTTGSFDMSLFFYQKNRGEKRLNFGRLLASGAVCIHCPADFCCFSDNQASVLHLGGKCGQTIRQVACLDAIGGERLKMEERPAKFQRRGTEEFCSWSDVPESLAENFTHCASNEDVGRAVRELCGWPSLAWQKSEECSHCSGTLGFMQGITLTTAYTGLGTVEACMRRLREAAPTETRAEYVFWSGHEIDARTRAFLLQSEVCPEHLFGDVLEQLPTETVQKMKFIQQTLTARCANLEDPEQDRDSLNQRCFWKLVAEAAKAVHRGTVRKDTHTLLKDTTRTPNAALSWSWKVAWCGDSHIGDVKILQRRAPIYGHLRGSMGWGCCCLRRDGATDTTAIASTSLLQERALPGERRAVVRECVRGTGKRQGCGAYWQRIVPNNPRNSRLRMSLGLGWRDGWVYAVCVEPTGWKPEAIVA